MVASLIGSNGVAVAHRGTPRTRYFSIFYPPVNNNSFVMTQNTMQINANFTTVIVLTCT